MISPDTIQAVRERTDILAVVGESVPTLKRRGRTFSGLCPFHKEKSPSFHVNPDRGFFHCFGCKESGSVIDFVMKHDGYTFPEAVRMLAERLGILVEEDSAPRTDADRQKKQKDDLYAVNQLAATYFETQLREHPHRSYAIDELESRGLVPGFAAESRGATPDAKIDDALQAFRIGYAPSGWDGLTNFLRAQGMSSMAAESVGLLVPRSSGSGHYDRFRHRLMFAVVDPQGRVLAFSGRALRDLPDEKPRDEKPAKYINSPESPIYSKGHALFGLHQAKSAIRSEQVAIVVEGNFDVVSLHARGLSHVVAPLGTAFTPDQAALLKRFAPAVVVLFDADLAGKKAVLHAREATRKVDLSVRVASLPEGKDPDELARTKGIEAVRQTVAAAKGMLEYLLDVTLDETFVAADAYERAARVEQVTKLLSEENDPLVSVMAKSYADRLASRLDLQRSLDTFQALERTVKRALASAGPRPDPVGGDPRRARIAPQAPEKPLRAAMVGAIIEFPELLGDAAVESALNLLEGPSAQTIAAISKSTRNGPAGAKTLDTSVFLAQIPPAIQEFAKKRMAAPLHDNLEHARGEFLRNAALLRRLVLSRESNEISRSTHKVSGDWQAELELAREVQARQHLKHAGSAISPGRAAVVAAPVPAHAEAPEDAEPEVQTAGAGYDSDGARFDDSAYSDADDTRLDDRPFDDTE